MKFKEIKPGMIIHCPKEEDARALLEHLESLGYIWCNGANICAAYSRWHEHCDRTGYQILEDRKGKITNGDVNFYLSKITEFSDLIEPDNSPINSDTDSSMTAKEILDWLTQCLTTYDVEKAKAFKRLYDIYGDEWGFTDLISEYTSKEIIDIITDYEAKKPEKPKPVEYGKYLAIISLEGDSLFAEEFWFDENEESYEDFKLDKMRDFAREIDGEVIARERDICRVVKE